MAKKKSSKDLITEALLLGFGLMDISTNKVEKMIKDVKRGRGITKEKSKKAAKDFIKGLEKSRKDIDAVVKRHLRKIVKDLDIATKSDLRRSRRK